MHVSTTFMLVVKTIIDFCLAMTISNKCQPVQECNCLFVVVANRAGPKEGWQGRWRRRSRNRGKWHEEEVRRSEEHCEACSCGDT